VGFYQLGEIRRRRGDAVGARESYASARRVVIDPQPGEGLLLLREGRAEDAWAAVSGALHGRDRVGRVRLLRAGVEIAISTGRLAEAAELTRELRSAADDYATPGFQAWADHAVGMLALAEDRTDDALAALRSAESVFRRDRLPYETAMTLLWIHRVHARAGDDELAERSHAQAQAILARLGADDPGGQAGSEAGADAYAGSASVGPLTAREAEILAVVAVGASNRIVAERLFISEKTVGRHLANIYAKLGVGSRTAAAAWWREHASSPDA
jgi:DNA-binding NarL/FixJ family response regulator